MRTLPASGRSSLCMGTVLSLHRQSNHGIRSSALRAGKSLSTGLVGVLDSICEANSNAETISRDNTKHCFLLAFRSTSGSLSLSIDDSSFKAGTLRRSGWPFATSLSLSLLAARSRCHYFLVFFSMKLGNSTAVSRCESGCRIMRRTNKSTCALLSPSNPAVPKSHNH
jgi:hypothetical protein